jgi:hypothetical protein
MENVEVCTNEISNNLVLLQDLQETSRSGKETGKTKKRNRQIH